MNKPIFNLPNFEFILTVVPGSNLPNSL